MHAHDDHSHARLVLVTWLWFGGLLAYLVWTVAVPR